MPDEQDQTHPPHQPGQSFYPQGDQPELVKTTPDPKPNGRKKPWIVVVFAVLLMAGSAFAWIWFALGDDSVSNTSINTFEECVAAGNPVMESYPEQCSANGQTFTRVLTDEEKAKLEDEINALEVPEGFKRYDAEEVGVAFIYPEEWGQPESTSTNTNWSLLFTNGVRLDAAASSTCPQGDDPLTSSVQGFLKKGDKYYRNWCPEEGLDQSIEVAAEGEDLMTLQSEGGLLVLYTERDDQCGNLACSPEDATRTNYQIKALFNVDRNSFTGVGVYFASLDKNEYTSVKIGLIKLLESVERL